MKNPRQDLFGRCRFENRVSNESPLGFASVSIVGYIY